MMSIITLVPLYTSYNMKLDVDRAAYIFYSFIEAVAVIAKVTVQRSTYYIITGKGDTYLTSLAITFKQRLTCQDDSHDHHHEHLVNICEL